MILYIRDVHIYSSSKLNVVSLTSHYLLKLLLFHVDQYAKEASSLKWNIF